MMTEPPPTSESEGPVCKICHKPLKAHTFQQQQECSKKLDHD